MYATIIAAILFPILPWTVKADIAPIAITQALGFTPERLPPEENLAALLKFSLLGNFLH